MKKFGMTVISLIICLMTLMPACQSTSTTSVAYKPQSWSTEPAMTIDQSKTYTADMKVSIDGKAQGDIIIELYPKDAPHAVNNFVFLAEHNFFNGITFHRIVKDFMIQGGDPLGNGTGTPGYYFPDDKPITRDYLPGTLAMANTGASNTNGSQFFICLTNLSDTGNKYHLTKNYVIFGMVTSGMNIVQKIASVPTTIGSDGAYSKPTQRVVITSLTITEK
jgi:cyclophilin family peptidyl-prolyl cis-trans isomerase